MQPYLLIFEDGGFSSAPEWQDDWQESVNRGVLEVIRYNELNGFECRMPEEHGQPQWQSV